jgi:hypothetical protein
VNSVVVDAARIEPVSISNSLLTGKLTGNFAETGLPLGILTPNRRANSMVCNQIPYATEQGIFKRVSGKIFQGTGNFHARCFDFEF